MVLTLYPEATFYRRHVRLLFFAIALFLLSAPTNAQRVLSEKQWIEQLNLKSGLPEKLLSARSVVFYNYTVTEKELNDAQLTFQRTGIDAVAYFELDMLMASRDVTKAFADYFAKREMTNLVLIEKTETDYRLTATTINGKETVIEPGQGAWSTSNRVFSEALKELYRSAANAQKKQNLLINDTPETGLPINLIVGKRNEFYAMDLKVDNLSVQKTGDEAIDTELEEIFKANYTLKYKMTEPALTEKEMRKQGLTYVLCFVHCRGAVGKELLGYDMSKSESALVSVTYPETTQQLKNIPSNTTVFKFYFKHIDSGNVFFGTKWDADETWQQALLNHLRGMKVELRIN
ncbi:hypothetical protein [Chryseolinea lacunae]|uniref:Uncharacterized protein n=1 Tax=Chryseolinea lacunae TaxID=2801331 RepID=A0ABS1KR61_9BACT|nr:hypothetical protein [Chryseolinea lacunae]MBL0741737.1 hypothetical protein [Chryseolinea lacunae]